MSFEEISNCLRRLDGLLAVALEIKRELEPHAEPGDPFRGLYLSGEELALELAHPPAESRLYSEADARVQPPLANAFELTPFDADVLVLAAAPELDRRYGRLYAFLQDDVTRRRPTVALALDLLCATGRERIAARDRFSASAPVMRHGIVRLVEDPAEAGSLLAAAIVADERVVRLLLGDRELDAALARAAKLSHPRPMDDPRAAAIARLVARGRAGFVHLVGPTGSGQVEAASAIAAALGRPLLTTWLARLPSDTDALMPRLCELAREARALGAVLLVESDAAPERRTGDAIRAALESAPAPVVLCGGWNDFARPSEPELAFEAPSVQARTEAWKGALERAGLAGRAATADALARRFRLDGARIEAAAARATAAALLRSPRARPTRRELDAAARAVASIDLAPLAAKVSPSYTWDDIVLPDDTLEQLRDLCRCVEQRDRVLDEWGFGRGLNRGAGVTALFAGPSGTGKTMAAEVVASDLGLDLYRIDLSGVVSKYVGETEKNLDRIFAAAEASAAVLLFDEADALFGKRSEVRDSHDRYANVEISYLLQRLETYEGLALLTTNLSGHLDDAFVRRLAFTIRFPFPGEENRRRIWAQVWPGATPVADDVDAVQLARELRFSGGNIRNVALGAAFLAAEDGGVVTLEHVLGAARRELAKLGKDVSPGDLGRTRLEKAA